MLKLWYLWGLGWLLMPRLTIGLILNTIGLSEIGFPLMVVGGFLDIIRLFSN